MMKGIAAPANRSLVRTQKTRCKAQPFCLKVGFYREFHLNSMFS